MDSRGLEVEVRLLGTPEMTVAGAAVEVGSAKQRALVAALALRPMTVLSSDQLVDVLWDEAPPDSAHTTLRSLVYRLRRAVGDQPFLVARAPGYVLDVPPERVDALRFERLLARARDAVGRDDPAAAAADLETGLALWRGPALGDLGMVPFFGPTARRLDDARLDAVELLAETELALGRTAEAVARLEAHLAAHPLRESGWRHLMLGRYRLGRQADALAAYQQVREILADELGIEPGPALRELEVAILQQRPELLGAPPPLAPPPPAPPRQLGDIVAFLFTDIESSTRRWERDEDAMAVDLARHDKLLREACERWGGRVFSHTGDGLCAAFPTAAAAIGAAVTGQEALGGERWDGRDALKVRMGVHAGAAERRADNYFGPTLNRTARLMASAWGGQIVCSALAGELAAGQLADGVSLRDLGAQRLADLDRPERVLQVVHPRLPADFPALRSAGTPRHNLPAALTSFVGRRRELAEVADALDGHRLVTLAGPGGAGKTRLALESAAAALERFPDGAWLVELAAVRDPATVPHAVAAALGLDPTALATVGRTPTEALCDQLRHRRALLVLDNCEHVVGAASAIAQAVLAHCTDIVVLATSRELLAVPGESVVRVGPLSLPPANAAAGATDVSTLAASDAVALLAERARETVAGFAVTAANAEAVVRICRRLDGSALGLELAASRMRLLSAQQLADRLDDRFRLLADGPRTSDPRHQTLQAAIDWSHDLLPEAERIVLRRLSVFPADFGLEAAEAVAGDPDGGPDPFEVLGLIGRLADKSLVMLTQAADGSEVRYQLQESIRQYAAGKLDDAGETGVVRCRHRDHFIDADWTVDEFLHTRWLHRARDEADNLRVALEWSFERGDGEEVLRLVAQQGVYWIWSGNPNGLAWTERAAALPESRLRAFALIGLAHLLFAYQEAGVTRFEPLMREALDIAVAEGDDVTACWVQLMWAQVAAAGGHVDECEAMVREVAARYPVRAPGVRAFEQVLWAGIHLAQGDLAAAREDAMTALTMNAQVGGDPVLLPTLAQLVLVEAAAGNAAAAQQRAAELVGAARDLPGTRNLVMGLIRAAEAAIVFGDVAAAVPHLDEGLGLLRELGGPNWAAEGLELTAIVLADTRPAAAATLLGSAGTLRGALREEDGVLPMLTDRLAACRQQVVDALGAPATAEAEKAGAALHLAEVLAFARAELRSA